MLSTRASAGYGGWLERTGTISVLLYAGLVIVLLPAFHYVLALQPNPPSDSLPLRLLGAAISLAVALAVLFVPGLRKVAYRLQLVHLLPVLIIVLTLIVNSGDNPYYVASGLLVIVGLQQAFFRVEHVLLAFVVGMSYQIGYSMHVGLWGTSQNQIALITYLTAYVIAIFPTIIAIRTREGEVHSRFDAENARADLASQLARATVLNKIVDYIRSTFDLREVLESVANALGPQLDADRVYVALWDEANKAMVVESEFRRDSNRVPSILGEELRSLRWSKQYRHLLSGKTIHITDVDAAEFSVSQREFLRALGTKEFAIVPILATNRRQLIGFIGLSNMHGAGEFTSQEIGFLEAIAGQVAIAIQQGRLYEQLQIELDHRRRQEVRLHDLANRDPLTGIFNRRYFLEELGRMVERTPAESPHGAVFFLDLDRFKIVNDTLGHDAGDRVLEAIPKVIGAALRESDLLARLGGDEFAVLLRDMRQTDSIRVAEKIRKRVAGYSFREGGKVFDLGVSIGVALVDGASSAQELLTRADEACYKAKAEGRNAIELWSRASIR